MSLTIKDSELKPRVKELSGFIAQELGVNVSQVSWAESRLYDNNAIERTKTCFKVIQLHLPVNILSYHDPIFRKLF